jgi:hypothetical protein
MVAGVRRFALLLIALLPLLAAAASSHAETPSDCIQVSVRSGRAPLEVSFQASCEATAYHWDFGDGGTADGPQVEHSFAAGAFDVSLTRQLADGATAASTLVITSLALRLAPLPVTRYEQQQTFRGALVPARPGVVVRLMHGTSVLGRVRTRADGSFAIRIRVRRAGLYRASAGGLSSGALPVVVRPRVAVALEKVTALGQPLSLRARVEPSSAGTLQALVIRDGKPRVGARVRSNHPLALPTARPDHYQVRLLLKPAEGYVGILRELRYDVVSPRLGPGSRGPLVLSLERSLVAHRFALAKVGSTYDQDTVDAVYALQKLTGLPRTGRVDAATWSALARLRPPRAQLDADYVEVDKTRQVLYVVRSGNVTLIVPVSTGASGNTPIGHWRVYSKIPGWSWVLYYPSYFLRGFAIHGYPDVPPWPASHGCVRVPMWVATRLYALIPNGSLIDIHY